MLKQYYGTPIGNTILASVNLCESLTSFSDDHEPTFCFNKHIIAESYINL